MELKIQLIAIALAVAFVLGGVAKAIAGEIHSMKDPKLSLKNYMKKTTKTARINSKAKDKVEGALRKRT